MKYVTEVRSIYTLNRNHAIEVTKEILESEGKVQVNVFGAHPTQLEGDKGYNVEVSYYEYTKEEYFAKKWKEDKDNLLDKINELSELITEEDIKSIKEYIKTRTDVILYLLKFNLIDVDLATSRLEKFITEMGAYIKGIFLYASLGDKLDHKRIMQIIKIYTDDQKYPEEELIDNIDVSLKLIDNLYDLYDDISNELSLYIIYVRKCIYDIQALFTKSEIDVDKANILIKTIIKSINSITNNKENITSDKIAGKMKYLKRKTQIKS